MRFADLVATSEQVAQTSRRSEKVRALADLFRGLAPEEVEPAVSFLTGGLRQGRIGVGWRTAWNAEPSAGGDPLTILDVDAAMDELAVTTGAGSQDARQRRLGALLGRASLAEQDFIRRVLVGELRQGALDGVVTDAVARASGVPLDDVRRAAMYAGDLGTAARAALTGGAAALAMIGLTVTRPVQPMLAQASATVTEALALTGPASVEWKLDGARIQVHRDGDDVRVFTRNLNDITERLPVVVDVVRGMPARRLVLDGEAIGLGEDDEPDRPQRFQDTMSTFGSEAGGDLRPFFFDILHVDGTDLVDVPLRERLEALDAVAAPLAIPRLVTTDAAAAEAFAADAVARGHEGVVVKALDTTYDAGRRGGAWRKVKPVHLLDLVVVAAEWGHGRRRGWLSNLHLGARDASTGAFVMVGKTFKGMTDALLTWQTERLQALAVATEEAPDALVVHVRPELVVEIALDGVQVSRRYPGGVALRFARVRRYRDDKRADEADTIDAVRALL